MLILNPYFLYKVIKNLYTFKKYKKSIKKYIKKYKKGINFQLKKINIMYI